MNQFRHAAVRVTTAALVTLALSGCRHAPLTYQLVPQGSSALLIPPARTILSNAPSFDLVIKNARQAKGSPGDCDIEGELISLQWEGRTANIKLKSESYVVEPEAGGAVQGPQKMFLDPLLSIERFRNDLENLETKGCLQSGESQRLHFLLSEKLPLPSEASYRFRFGSFELTGIFDLVSDFRLNVNGPVYSSSENNSAKHVIGYERAYYIFTPAQNSDRTKISFASATETDVGKAPFPKSAPQNTLALPESPGYFRLVLRTEAAASENISIATLLSAPDKKTLADATRQLMSGPAQPREIVTAPGANCMTFPPRVGVGIELGVQVNGRQVFVGLGGSLAGAIRSENPPADFQKTLQVRRFYQGNLIPIAFDPASPAILKLVLMPGDEITWAK
jgi:hypothetical protein